MTVAARSLATSLLIANLVAACSGEGGAVQGPSSPAEPGAPTAQPSPTAAPSGAPGSEVTPPAPTGLTFPPASGSGAWATIDAASAGFDPAKLDELTTWIGQASSTTFVVLVGGKILVEKYWDATDTTLRDIASAQKSIVSMMVGAAADKGAFGLDDTVTSLVGAGWSNDTPANEDGITVRHLLTMTSGLDDDLMRVAAPGTVWRYNTNAYHRLELVLTQKTGKTIDQLTRMLFDPIGAGASAWSPRPFQKDAKGVPINALEMSARDMARVGLLVQADGAWNGTRLVPSAYLGTALATSQTLNPSYGFLWWLNGKSSYVLPPSTPKQGMLMPSAPIDLVAALGAADQKIYVSRAANLVVVRQGKSAGAGAQALSGFDDELWKRLLAAKKSP